MIGDGLTPYPERADNVSVGSCRSRVCYHADTAEQRHRFEAWLSTHPR